MSKVVVSLREAVRLMREELRRRWTLSPSGRYAVPSPMGMLSPKGMLSPALRDISLKRRLPKCHEVVRRQRAPRKCIGAGERRLALTSIYEMYGREQIN
jgi:hypothetical protein